MPVSLFLFVVLSASQCSFSFLATFRGTHGDLSASAICNQFATRFSRVTMIKTVMKLVAIARWNLLVAACLLNLVGKTVAQPPQAATGLDRLRYNNPGLVVDLGVGLWAWPVPCDADGDGDFDLIVVSLGIKEFDSLRLCSHMRSIAEARKI